jgi:hypothetical protein
LEVGVRGTAQLDYQELIIQSGFSYEIAKWANSGGPGFTALDVMGSARYWNQQADISLKFTGTATVDLQRLGLKFSRSRNFLLADGGTLEWGRSCGRLAFAPQDRLGI